MMLKQSSIESNIIDKERSFRNGKQGGGGRLEGSGLVYNYTTPKFEKSEAVLGGGGGLERSRVVYNYTTPKFEKC
jgi:hypothetical protein